MKYHAKTLFTGKSIGLSNTDIYVGVPEKFNKVGKEITHAGKTMVVINPSFMKRDFDDKFGRGKWSLYYHKWEPKGEQ